MVRNRDLNSRSGDDQVGSFFREIDLLQRRLCYEFSSLSLLIESLTHKSVLVDWGRGEAGLRSTGRWDIRGIYMALGLRSVSWNERLEFLGDAVLGLVISSRLIGRSERFEEGKLSKIRAALVNERSLAERAEQIALDRCLILGRSEERAGGRARASILADALEAVFGAIFVDGGFEAAHRVISLVFEEALQGDLRELLWADYKSLLQEEVQQKWKVAPSYETVEEQGPDHQKLFRVAVTIAGTRVAVGDGISKKAASQGAAYKALQLLEGVQSMTELQNKEEAQL